MTRPVLRIILSIRLLESGSYLNLLFYRSLIKLEWRKEDTNALPLGWGGSPDSPLRPAMTPRGRAGVLRYLCVGWKACLSGGLHCHWAGAEDGSGQLDGGQSPGSPVSVLWHHHGRQRKGTRRGCSRDLVWWGRRTVGTFLVFGWNKIFIVKKFLPC